MSDLRRKSKVSDGFGTAGDPVRIRMKVRGDWLDDFLNHSGQNAGQRNLNAGDRVLSDDAPVALSNIRT
jgi:hypothetical protein